MTELLSLGATDNARRIAQAVEDFINSSTRIVVFGEFSAGKSRHDFTGMRRGINCPAF
jgi:hypothetical protein